ncbi:SLAM family member 7-like [Gracilinanus agilis]|uniref:SLAM family member 7-like n=1 Tax=Gracilinanus agilis TaxID=191870 RepID=UPI001CFEC629|nr:SLAM family member 7-like [Gracilinanus agilis]
MLFSRWKLCLLLLMISSQVYSARHVISAVGDSVSLKNSEPYTELSEVSWFYNETQKILRWTREEETTIFETNMKPRISFDVNNITIHIKHVQKEDSSIYKLQTFSFDASQEHSEHIRLDVYERLTKPKITASPRFDDNGTCLVNLTCSVEQIRENASYSWMSKGQGVYVSTRGPILTFIWKPGDHDLNYTCTAKNPVSNNSSSVLAKELCAGKTSRMTRELLVIILPSIFSLLFALNWTQ